MSLTFSEAQAGSPARAYPQLIGQWVPSATTPSAWLACHGASECGFLSLALALALDRVPLVLSRVISRALAFPPAPALSLALALSRSLSCSGSLALTLSRACSARLRLHRCAALTQRFLRQPIIAGSVGARRFQLPQSLSDAGSESEDAASAGTKRQREEGSLVGKPSQGGGSNSDAGAVPVDGGLLLWQLDDSAVAGTCSQTAAAASS